MSHWRLLKYDRTSIEIARAVRMPLERRLVPMVFGAPGDFKNFGR